MFAMKYYLKTGYFIVLKLNFNFFIEMCTVICVFTQAALFFNILEKVVENNEVN